MNIIGHHQERAKLKALVTTRQVSQSILFVGPENIGKRLVAFEWALELVEQQGFNPSLDQATPLDIQWLEPTRVVRRSVARKKGIGVEETRAGLRFLRLSSQEGVHKVLIVDDAHLLTPASQNMLLKFVEEPEPGTVIIFITHERKSLIPTLLSRLSEVRFGFVPVDTLKKEGAALGLTVGDALPEFFFRLGRPGVLLQAIDNPKAFQKKKELLTKLFQISTLSLRARLTLADELAKDVPVLIQLFEWFVPGLYARSLEVKEEEQIKKHLVLLEQLDETLMALKRPEVQARLTLEHLFLSLP
jgi:hypothetical protein